jgi:hypothetical protein
MYTNLHQAENNRFAKQSHFESLKTLTDRMLVPTPTQLAQIDVNELFVKIEFRAITKIRLFFMEWFQQLAENMCKYGDNSSIERP